MASPRSDADRVLNAGISLALDKLVGEGRFYPFGVALTRSGDMQVFTAQESTAQQPASDAFLDALRDTLTTVAGSGDVVAAAVVADFAFEAPAAGGERDAIRVALESEAGEAVTCYLPYTLVMPGGTRDVRPGTLFARPGTPSIFPSPG